jgi:SAM-dependent methyltransferase
MLVPATLTIWIALFFVPVFAAPPTERPAYEYQEDHDPDGIGKIFMGREIARVMGHQGAPWLERPEREDEEKPTLVLDVIRLKSGDTVADIGAGTGYFSWRMAQVVGATGRVYAVDIQPEMLALLEERMKSRGVNNVLPVLGTITDPKLPENSIDLAIMVDVYHEFSHPYEMMEAIVRALKPNGRLVFVEYRAEDRWVPIKRLHKMSEEQIKKEAEIHSLVWLETSRVLPRQHILIFEKRSGAADAPSTR